MRLAQRIASGTMRVLARASLWPNAVDRRLRARHGRKGLAATPEGWRGLALRNDKDAPGPSRADAKTRGRIDLAPQSTDGEQSA
jgi:hypothetical protein